MKTFVKFLRTETITNREKGTVVFIAKVKMDYLGIIGIDNSLLEASDYRGAERISTYLKERTFAGKAVCTPTDVFDPVLGKRIAESRCKQKIYKFYRNVYLDLLEMANKRCHTLSVIEDAVFNCWVREGKHELELLGIKLTDK